jgi:type VI secretion system protein ImpM
MRCSLFGKLAAKRDFIAVSAPREFLSAWEPWMQSCVSASRDQLGEAWLPAYLTAPIWRFWLGADICGATVIGALMASLDGVGRYYPLTVFAYAEPAHAIAPPDLDPQDAWFSAAEAFLLSTLEREVAFETITEALEQLTVPAAQPAGLPAEETSIRHDGIIGTALADRTFAELFTLLRVANSSNVYAAASFWWTVGGGDCPPFGFCCQRMPAPLMFTTMLTGRIGSAPTQES